MIKETWIAKIREIGCWTEELITFCPFSPVSAWSKKKRLGTDLVTLSIKHSAIVVEPFLIQSDLAIDGYRWYYNDPLFWGTTTHANRSLTRLRKRTILAT